MKIKILTFYLLLFISQFSLIGCANLAGAPVITNSNRYHVTIEYDAWGLTTTTLTQEAINLAEKHCAKFNRTAEHLSSKAESRSTANEIHQFRCKGNTDIQNNLKNYIDLDKEESSDINKSLLDTAKDECKKIGFTEKTEEFGDCVLKLSK